jgi:ATP-dependent DNA helicase RecG
VVVGRLASHKIIAPRNRPFVIQKWRIQNKSGTTTVTATRFLQHAYYRSHNWQQQQSALYPAGSLLLIKGQVEYSNYEEQLTIRVVEIEHCAGAPQSSIIPVYALTEGVTASTVQSAIQKAIAQCSPIADPLPVSLRRRYQLLSLQRAILELHQPTSLKRVEAARQRVAFDELFYSQLRLLCDRQQQAVVRSPIVVRSHVLKAFYQQLPFSLHESQQEVIEELLSDLAKPVAMQRLVQGDVGSGKTVVAIAALAAVASGGGQAALLAPTEVLAQQLYDKCTQWLLPLGIAVGILTGSIGERERQSAYHALKHGWTSIIVGTHALFHEYVEFQQLDLVVIDECHRFGVEQQQQLIEKGDRPHLLLMSATPIPRTLALTRYGHLDCSIVQSRPGRQSIATVVLSEGDRPRALAHLAKELQAGHQAYVVLPLVEDSDALNLRSVASECAVLQAEFAPFRVAALHGQMPDAEKLAILDQFRDAQVQVLVASTVIEVGIDVPNATVILIDHADRFGLAQLHQLRGRVGRGMLPATCYLVTSSEQATDRLQLMATSADGFAIAEADLQWRGPGELLGTQQHGRGSSVVNWVSDRPILEQAREAAQRILKKGDRLKCWPRLMREMHLHSSGS